MSIVIKNIALKNFLSVGAVTQAVDFQKSDLTLILGENVDLGGDGSRNGVGKTALIQALSYALYGTAINNIKKDNLINHTNGKSMVVTVEFDINGTAYRITRCRKPNILKFYVGDQQLNSEDDAQGDSRETQQQIERVLNMSHDMFKQIVALNTYNEPFLAMKVSDQRTIIEQLLGITLLSEKAEILKVLNKDVKDQITAEEFRIRGVDDANKRIQEQIDALLRRQSLWATKYEQDLQSLKTEQDVLLQIDIDSELANHGRLKIYNEKMELQRQRSAIVVRQQQWASKREADVTRMMNQLVTLDRVDIAAELQAHIDLATYSQSSKDIAELKRWIASCQIAERREQAVIDKIRAEIESLKNNRCHACGQDFHDEQHTDVLAEKQKELQEAALQALATNTQLMEHTDALNELGELGAKPTTHYPTQAEAIKHNTEIENLAQQIEAKKSEVDPYADQLAEFGEIAVGDKPATIYRTEAEVHKHMERLANLIQQYDAKLLEVDPYAEQLADMTTNGLQELNFDELTRLTRQLQHQEYLLDLLTNKKSFVRKKIIDQNLAYLNARLAHYLEKMGLPHTVKFQNDLSVEIQELGRDLDYGNLSRGEGTRLTLSMSFAFRDVFESLYTPINTLFVDELLDNGLDTLGVENGVALLKDLSRRRGKSVWLVSHRDELVSRVHNVLKVVKEGGFTTFTTAGAE
jgi:DNA repair exonuclease SbcCD ATPase subunit